MKCTHQILSMILFSGLLAACTQISTSNNACSMAGLYNNSYDCQSSTNTNCSMAVIQNDGSNQVCFQKGLVVQHSSPTATPSSTPNSSVTPTPTTSPSNQLMVNTTAYFVYQLNATDGIRFSVTSVPNTPTLKIHVYSNKQVTQNIDLNLTPADNLALYNNAVKVLTGQFYLVNSGNTNLGTNTSAAVVISYSPYTSTYTFYNPGVWTGSQSIGFFDAMIVWIREKL